MIAIAILERGVSDHAFSPTDTTIIPVPLPLYAMSENDELYKIVKEETTETFESFTDLDSISDTTVLAITFLLSAQVTLSALLLDSSRLTDKWVEAVFIGIGLVTILFIFLSLNAIVKALLPVEFYGSSAGEPILDHKLFFIPWSDPNQFSFFGSSSSIETSGQGDTDTDERRTSARHVAENFVEGYNSAEEIQDYETYEYAKLRHYKQVGKRKAEYTGVGLEWLRYSVALFLAQFIVLFAEVIIS